ncbi:4-hydroxy-2-oxoglutarate aldolase, mitochondrial-like [Hydractinia symbiolongicarpus]|uniref:4-hydroxy-2-oxoglutarate aldolase, mitochondrial-like n=1 Tax=Hydractinia symbiolongicarpus TaxID=13093 RepID=UPI00254FE3F5|nr:4-hydroxy-2-oxoglutarate aldolase, mitochondrial-like [Hydractinia symbiolongicarpus]
MTMARSCTVFKKVFQNSLCTSSIRYLSTCSPVQQKLDLCGIFPPIATPFKENEDIAWGKFEENLQKWDKIPFKGYLVLGSNGEYVSLSNKERVDIVKFVKKSVKTSKLVLAGPALEGTKETLRLTKEMADVGADAVVVTTPSFFKNRMNYDAMMKHYTTIADFSPVPVILYNVPSNTGVEFPLNAVFELAKHSNIIGIKDSCGNITNLGHIIERTSHEDFQVLVGAASLILPAMQLGAVGSICALANILGEKCCNLYSMVGENKLKAATHLQLSLIAANQTVTRKYNVPAMKYAMDLLGYYGGPCRSPLTPLSDAEKADIENVFKDYIK